MPGWSSDPNTSAPGSGDADDGEAPEEAEEVEEAEAAGEAGTAIGYPRPVEISRASSLPPVPCRRFIVAGLRRWFVACSVAAGSFEDDRGTLRPMNTLSGSQQASMRNQLIEEREAADGQIAELTRSFEEIVEAVQDTNNDDEHDPEGTTIAFERAQVAALLNQAKADRDAIDEALAKIDAGEYGACADCGEPIGAERLAAIPSASKCISCA